MAARAGLARSPDRLLSRRAIGSEAARVLALVGPRLTERRERLIGQMVSTQRAGRLTPDAAYLFACALAATEELRDDLAHLVHDGQRAAAELRSD